MKLIPRHFRVTPPFFGRPCSGRGMGRPGMETQRCFLKLSPLPVGGTAKHFSAWTPPSLGKERKPHHECGLIRLSLYGGFCARASDSGHLLAARAQTHQQDRVQLNPILLSTSRSLHCRRVSYLNIRCSRWRCVLNGILSLDRSRKPLGITPHSGLTHLLLSRVEGVCLLPLT